MEARRQPKPEMETVQFINDKVLYAFDINHLKGTFPAKSDSSCRFESVCPILPSLRQVY